MNSQPIQEFVNKNSNTKKKVPVAVIIASVGIICVIVVVVMFLFMIFNKPYEKPIEEMFALLNEKEDDYYEYAKYYMLDAELIYNENLEVTYEEFKVEVEEMYIEDLISLMTSEAGARNSEKIELFISLIEAVIGDDYEISYSIDNADKMSKDDIEKYQENYDRMASYKKSEPESHYLRSSIGKKILDYYDNYIDELENIEIEEGYKLELDVTLEGELDKISVKIEDIAMLKIDDKWVSQSLYDVLFTPICNELIEIKFKDRQSTSVGFFKKSLEYNDLEILDSIYGYINDFMTDENNYDIIDKKITNNSIESFSLKELYFGDTTWDELAKEMKKNISEIPSLKANCNDGGEITIVFVKENSLKFGVCIKDSSGNILTCDYLLDKKWNYKEMSVGTVDFEK